MRPIIALTLGFLAFASYLQPAPAHAELTASASATTNKPLIIIRFNQRNVYYQRSLTMAVKKAEETKPDIRYEVISYVPGQETPETSENLQVVLGTMISMGVDKSRMQTTSQAIAPGYAQEIHIFVY